MDDNIEKIGAPLVLLVVPYDSRNPPFISGSSSPLSPVSKSRV